MELENFCSCTGEALLSNMYWTFVTHRTKNTCMSYFCVKVSRMVIYFCGIIHILFSCPLYCVVLKDGIVGAGFFVYPPLEAMQLLYVKPLVVQDFPP